MTFTQKANLSRILVLIGLLSLIAIYCAIHILSGSHILLKCAISAIPLAIFVPGVAARRYRTGSLLCFVLLMYFMVATDQLFIPGSQLLDSLIMVVVVGLFTTSMFYARWQQRADVLEGDPDNGRG